MGSARLAATNAQTMTWPPKPSAACAVTLAALVSLGAGACSPGIVGPAMVADAGGKDDGIDAGTTPADAGTADAGTADAGTADAGTADAGTADAGTADAGTADAGTADAGTADAGTADAGTADAGSADGGAADQGPPASCKPDCSQKSCGDDGCGGTCGGCPPAELCGPASRCVAPSSSTALVVDARSQGTTISTGIYGVALNSDASLELATLNRWGGDSTNSYNWQSDSYNSGGDWYCANYQGMFTSPTPDPGLKTSSDQFVHFNMTQKVDTLMTIPITGWVATGAIPYQALLALPDCVDAVQGVWSSSESGKCCTALGTSYQTHVDAAFMTSWVQHLASTFGTAAKGGVRYYQLDNEPDNWQALRTDIYPTLYPPGGWCEPFYSVNSAIGKSLNQDFIDRTLEYAKAVKEADPTAKVLFMCTENAWDLVALPNVECGTPQGPYTVDSSMTRAILELAAQEEQATGVRVLDCVDMHYPVPYPSKGLGDTKALWDSSGNDVAPHIQDWINASYPGTGICVSEYNVTGDGGDGKTPDPSSAAQFADVLGMYGRLGYKAAAYWGSLVHQGSPLPIRHAMAMYRSYDGLGGQFGAYSAGAASSNPGVHVFAASDSPTNPTKLWVMLVNVSDADQNALDLTLQNFVPTGDAAVYRTDGTSAPAAGTAVPIKGGTITGLSLPRNSIALLVLSR